MILQERIDELMIDALDDRIDAAWINSVMREVGGVTNDPDAGRLGLRIVRELLDRGLAVAGDVTEEAGFLAWDLPLDEICRRTEQEWMALSHGPGLGDICWFSPTERGRKRARRRAESRRRH